MLAGFEMRRTLLRSSSAFFSKVWSTSGFVMTRAHGCLHRAYALNGRRAFGLSDLRAADAGAFAPALARLAENRLIQTDHL